MSFDTLAPHYRWMEWLLAGGKLQRCREAFLPEVQNCRNVLLLGEGNGRFLESFVQVNRSAHITVLDASAEMLRRAKDRIRRHDDSSRFDFIHADVFTWNTPARSFDLIVTNFFFDCFRPEQLATLIPRLAAGAAQDVQWIISDFRIPSRGFGRWRAQWITAAMYGFFRIATNLPARSLTPVDPLLLPEGFHLRARRVTEWGLLHSDLWERASA
jgi:hypothetical protein